MSCLAGFLSFGLSTKNRDITWVPMADQRTKGGLIRTFYYANRVLDRDAFWVQV